MHRQGYDLQLTQYDERRWRATFYVTGTGTPAHERHWNGMEAQGVACYAAGGVGGAAKSGVNAIGG